MNQNQVQNLKGFRDYLPANQKKRQFVQDRLQQSLAKFGFEPLASPTLEYAQLLLGKYGTEADKLVYTFADQGKRQIGLRYDQTVPTARILAQYQNELPKFFRRYQIQNVFRAEKPQQGRWREFTQCDIDIFGSQAPLADAEILAATYQVFADFGCQEVILKINDRQLLLTALSPLATDQVDVFSIIQSLDKLDKLKAEQIQAELVSKGLSSDTADQALSAVSQIQISPQLAEIKQFAIKLGVPESVLQFTPSLARGLDYYTGLIFEISLPQYSAGSVGGGGRYDNLIGQLSGYQLPAVGMAFGLDRLIDALDQLQLLPTFTSQSQILVTLFSAETLGYSLKIANQLRVQGYRVELFPELAKLDKQFKLANQKKIPWVIVAGETEQATQKISLKNMTTGEQQTINLAEIDQLITAAAAQ